jgi:long-subunit acyl-CoA synthetase (AMP-forming)
MQAATGGSATSPQVMEFLRECLKCPVVDAYGTTEVGPPPNRPHLWIGR